MSALTYGEYGLLCLCGGYAIGLLQFALARIHGRRSRF
jgi:hypothetical protein